MDSSSLRRLVLLCVLGCLWPGGTQAHAAPLSRHAFAQIHMGTKVRLVVYAPDEATAERGAEAAFERVRELEAKLSDYRASSELSKLGELAVNRSVEVSRELWSVLWGAQKVWQVSDGAFDASIGPVVRLWRDSRRSGRLPDPGLLAAALRRSGWRHVHLDPAQRTVELDQPDMVLDLGGIAKGFVGDEVLKVLRAAGLPQALYEAGGDIVLGDAPPGLDGWRIAMSQGRMYVLSNCAVAASGDTYQAVVVDGRRYSHVVDPRTGIGLTDHVMAHVVAPSGLEADALATACGVLGVVGGTALVKAWPGAWGFVEQQEPALEAEPVTRRVFGRGLF